MFCPNCGQEYDASERTCPNCDVDLVATRPANAPDPEVTLVPVFETTDPALLPLATMKLDEHGIEYSVEDDSTLAALRYMPAAPDLARSDATHQIVVRQDDAGLARELLSHLVGSAATIPAPIAEAAPASPAPVVDLESGFSLGSLTQDQAAYLIDVLEEEVPDEARYYIDAATIDMLETKGADPDLVTLLRRALGARDGMEIRF